jgi:hypothetical protein
MDSYPIEKVILIYNKHIYDRYKSLIDSSKKKVCGYVWVKVRLCKFHISIFKIFFQSYIFNFI